MQYKTLPRRAGRVKKKKKKKKKKTAWLDKG